MANEMKAVVVKSLSSDPSENKRAAVTLNIQIGRQNENGTFPGHSMITAETFFQMTSDQNEWDSLKAKFAIETSTKSGQFE